MDLLKSILGLKTIPPALTKALDTGELIELQDPDSGEILAVLSDPEPDWKMVFIETLPDGWTLHHPIPIKIYTDGVVSWVETNIHTSYYTEEGEDPKAILLELILFRYESDEQEEREFSPYMSACRHIMRAFISRSPDSSNVKDGNFQTEADLPALTV